MPEQNPLANGKFAGQVPKYNTFLRPAFASNWAAFWFMVVVVFALLLPKMITNTGLVSRETSYESMPENQGAYLFIKDEIFNKTGEIDLLFIGSSVLWNAIDTPQVQRALTEKLGRRATVITFGFNFNGIDIPYAQLRDLVKRRRVRLVMLSIPRLPYTDGPSTTAWKFLRYDEDPEILAGLPLRSRIALYAGNILRSPRDVLGILRENHSSGPSFAKNLGANKELLGMNRDPRAFERFAPASPIFAPNRLIYSPRIMHNFVFTQEDLTPHQDHYLNRLVDLLHENGIRLAILNVPQYSEKESGKVIERFDWSNRFGRDIPLVGVPPSTLFDGFTEKEVEKLHCDREHFNANGNEYFTRSILPGIMEVYDRNAIHHF